MINIACADNDNNIQLQIKFVVTSYITQVLNGTNTSDGYNVEEKQSVAFGMT